MHRKDSNGATFKLNGLGREDMNSHPLVVEDITVVYARAHWHHWHGGALFNLPAVGHGEGGYTLTFRNIVVEDSASKRSIRRFVITEKAPTRAFSWLKAKRLLQLSHLRHYHRRSWGIFKGGPTISFCQNSILFCQKNILSEGAKFSNFVLPS